MKYLKQNTLEAIGFISYKERTNYYAKWLGAPVEKQGSVQKQAQDLFEVRTKVTQPKTHAREALKSW